MLGLQRVSYNLTHFVNKMKFEYFISMHAFLFACMYEMRVSHECMGTLISLACYHKTK